MKLGTARTLCNTHGSPHQRLRIIGDSVHTAHRQVIRDKQGAVQKRCCVYQAPCTSQVILSGKS